MSLQIACERCGQPMKLPDEAAGRRAKCKACGHVFRVPDAGGTVGGTAKPRRTRDAGDTAGATATGTFVGSATGTYRAASRSSARPAPTPAPATPPPPSEGDDLLMQLAALDEGSGGDAPAGKKPKRSKKPLFTPAPTSADPDGLAPGVSTPPPAPVSSGRWDRNKRSRATSEGLDSLSPLLLLGFLAVLGGLAYVGIAQAGRAVEAQAAAGDEFQRSVLEAAGYAGRARTNVLIGAAVTLVSFFVAVVPLTLAGVFAGSKLMRFGLAGAAYLRASGVAGAAGIVLGGLFLLGGLGVLPKDAVVPLLFYGAAVVAAFFALKFVFELTAVEAGVTLPIAGVLGLVGAFVGASVTNSVAESRKASLKQHVAAVAADLKANPPGKKAAVASKGPTPEENAAKAEAARVATLVADAEAIAPAASRDDLSRESAAADLAALREKVDAEPDAPALDPARAALADAEARVAALPSGEPDPAVFEPIPTDDLADLTTPDVRAAGLDDPVLVSGGAAAFRPPTSLRLDLAPLAAAVDPDAAADSGADLTWRGWGAGMAGVSVTVRGAPRSDEKQMRPVIVERPFQRAGADAAGLFAVDGRGAEVSTAVVHGVPYTVLTGRGAGREASLAVTDHVAAVGDRWVVVTTRVPSSDPAAQYAMSTSLGTIRPAGEATAAEATAGGGSAADPLSPARLAARLADDPDHATTLLVAAGPDAESAVVPYLKSDDAEARRAAAVVLASVGTATSLDALRAAYDSGAPAVSSAARAALARIAPEQYDAVALAVLDLARPAPATVRDGVLALAASTPPDDVRDPRREQVASALIAAAPDATTYYDDPLVDAIALWATPRTVPQLADVLGETARPVARDVAIRAAGRIKDPRLVFPVVRWLIKEPRLAKSALIEMGPVAEQEVSRVLRESDPTARKAAAEVLEVTGGYLSRANLQRASRDPRDPDAAAAAAKALDAVNARIAAGK